MPEKRTLFWGGILLCLLLLFAWGIRLYTRKHQSVAGATVAFSVGADSLYSQYQRDEHTADSLYLGKVIEVRGKLGEIQHNGVLEIWILSTGGGGGVNCQLFPGEKYPGGNHRIGDSVSIRGKCTGFLMDVTLSDCVFQ
ncbi:MAG: hypothetical protein P4L51_02685 [Puia sp.]|nr:hypothetical protein [Puia sp.]